MHRRIQVCGCGECGVVVQLLTFWKKVFVNRSMALFQNQKRKTLRVHPRGAIIIFVFLEFCFWKP